MTTDTEPTVFWTFTVYDWDAIVDDHLAAPGAPIWMWRTKEEAIEAANVLHRDDWNDTYKDDPDPEPYEPLKWEDNLNEAVVAEDNGGDIEWVVSPIKLRTGPIPIE